MKVSVVIPAYNEEALLPDCIRAVQQEVAASGLGDDAEIIVVNNASTDRTKEVAQRFAAVRVVDEPRKGLTRAREAGFRAAAGELIANPDADTRMPRGWLSVVVQEFERDPALLALSGPYIYFDLPWYSRALVFLFNCVAFLTYLINRHVLRVGAMIQGGNFVVRRSALEKIGGYDTSIEFYGEDTDIARRVSEIGKVKWTWRLYMHSSGRRLAHEGIVTIGLRYALNYLTTTFLKKPVTIEYTDIRPK